jgi:ribonucleoside-diphosphate reductase alpha chain
MTFSSNYIESLNRDIKLFPNVFPITEDMKIEREGVSRLVMLDRYTFKDIAKVTLKVGDFVVLQVKSDPKFPAQGLGWVKDINGRKITIEVEEEFRAPLEGKEAETGIVVRDLDAIEKPLELFYEQIAMRNAKGLSDVEETPSKKAEWFSKFYHELVSENFVPAGRVLYGAGAGTDVTYFNCYVMPYPKDSREGIADHRKIVQEIMSRGGGVGTNGSTLRPRNTLARGVNGKSSGSVSWLNDIANLTNLVEQGGSRRGAQMIMLADWHPDVLEFIISKMQNPRVLRFIIENTNDEQIKQLAKSKLKFTPLTKPEELIYQEAIIAYNRNEKPTIDQTKGYELSKQKLNDGGTYSVHNPEFLTGANISVALTHEFMHAVENDLEYELRFPHTDSYNEAEMAEYNEKWHTIGDVREWERLGYKIRTYRKIKAKELWNLINIAATYSAEPGIFFIDNANDMTNAKAYGQQVVCTNPCGEQPLAPFSVCNLAAVNLAEMTAPTVYGNVVDYDKLIETVKVGIRMQDNVISATPYFLEENKIQALGERRIGLGVMGLHDLLIQCELVYGTEEGNKVVDKVFETIAIAAYEASIELAKEKGSFPFLTNGYKLDIDMNGYIEQSMEKRRAFINSGYMKKMPEHIRQGVLKHGIRNSHLLTVAPTGSTGTMVNVSTGLEPYFSFSYFRSGRLGKFIEVKAPIAQQWFDNYYKENPDASEGVPLPPWFISSMELSPEAHADVQCIIQRWIDSSISKTVNAPKGYTVEQVQKVYERLHKGGAKGGTVYVDGSRDSQVLSLTNEENKVEETNVLLESKKEEVETKDEINYGSEVGDTCPACRAGKVIDSGGCNTCSNCGMQLKCGL